jgi:hypothetical protein
MKFGSRESRWGESIKQINCTVHDERQLGDIFHLNQIYRI